MTDYRIEWRAGVPVVLGDGEGCHPASDAEVAFWRRIAELEHKLRVANDALRLVCATKADPIVRPTHEWGYAKRIAELEREVAQARAEERHANETVASLFAKITTLVDKARAEEREAIVEMLRKAANKPGRSLEKRSLLMSVVDRIQRRAQEGSDG